MIIQEENESRIEYLVRVLDWFMQNTCAGELTADYDDTTCDGYCLVDDFKNEIGL